MGVRDHENDRIPIGDPAVHDYPIDPNAWSDPSWQVRVNMLYMDEPDEECVQEEVPVDRTFAAKRRMEKLRTYDLYILNLSYEVPVRANGSPNDTYTTLLNRVTAQAHHGEVLGILGPTGSSKTTLLDALAGRIEWRSLRGSVLANGRPLDSKFKRVSGYVMQDDALFPFLTVRETLMFSARLRLDQSTSTEEKKLRVGETIEQLGLEMCADSRVGSDKIIGISRGERRRVSIGVDIIHDPSVLFLDEPTSGLDRKSALQVMKHLCMMAEELRCTVIVTLQEPTHAIMRTIHNALVLVQGGNVVYHGPPSGMVNYFSEIGYTMPDHVNSAEYMLEVITDLEESAKGVHKAIELYLEKQKLEEEVKRADFGGPEYETPDAYSSSFMMQTRILASRSFKTIVRTRDIFVTRMLIMVVAAILLGSVFFRCTIDEVGIRKRLSFVSLAVAFCIVSMAEALPLYVEEHKIFVREVSKGAYRPSAYVLSTTLVILPFLFFLALTFSCISYVLVGFQSSAAAMSIYTLFFFLVLVVSQSFIIFAAALIPDLLAGRNVVLLFFGACFLFSGFFLHRAAIPMYWRWMHYLSFFTYPYEAILNNEFNHMKGVVWYGNVTSEQVLAENSLQAFSPGVSVVIMLLFFVGYRTLYYSCLRLKVKTLKRF